MSVAPLLMNNLDNSKQKTSNLLSPAPPPYSWSLLGKSEGPAPPPSSKISWSFDLAWSPEAVPWKSIYTTISAEALLSVVSWGSRPTEILSDRGTQFTSDLTKEVFILVSSADHFATSPCHAQTNGTVEQFNGTLTNQYHGSGDGEREMRNRIAISTYQLCRLHTDGWQWHTFNPNSAVSSQIKIVCIFPLWSILWHPILPNPPSSDYLTFQDHGEKRPPMFPNFPGPEKDTTVFPKCTKPVRTTERGLSVVVVGTLRSLVKGRRLLKETTLAFRACEQRILQS